MTSMGFQALAGRIPGERIATTIRTTNVGPYTTAETELDSVTAPLVQGRTYRVRWFGTQQTTVAGDSVQTRMRQDSTAGTQMQSVRTSLSVANTGFGITSEAEFTATSTGNKTFVVTGQRLTGTGNITAAATAAQPVYMYVDYIRG